MSKLYDWGVRRAPDGDCLFYGSTLSHKYKNLYYSALYAYAADADGAI